MDRNQQIAQIILDQIGSRALFMLGASKKPIVAIENGVQFKVGRNAKGVNAVRITLTAADLYELEFSNVNVRRRDMVKVIATAEGIYAEHLNLVIEAETGLATHL